MPEYIDRERLKEAFTADLQTLQTLDEHTIDIILWDIDEAPAADVAPVVHAEWDIDEAPAADVAPVVHAEWEIDEFGRKCSACKEYIPDDFVPSEYCPHCGAKMDGGNNNV